MFKKLPVFRTDKEAEDFVANSDLTKYDLSQFKPAKFEFVAKDQKVNMRLPGALLDAVKARAKDAGMPYQRYIRSVLEAAVTQGK